MAYNHHVPKITLVFVGFPSANQGPSGAGPARTVMTDLPIVDPRSPRPPSMLDIIARVKKEHFANDHSIDLSRASVYTGPPEFALVRPSNPAGILRDGDFLLVVCSGGSKGIESELKLAV
ncbi:hypothetical protein HDU67_006298 [Dinochytrium kinnereticum]|nr:hypothetical protein HDU67_006298 [Dinochytrium kinnereticum]